MTTEAAREKCLTNLSYAHTDRLRFIDMKMQTQRFINRDEIMKQFRISSPTATNDIKRYKKANPDALFLNWSNKRYEPTANFKPLFPDEVTEND